MPSSTRSRISCAGLCEAGTPVQPSAGAGAAAANGAWLDKTRPADGTLLCRVARSGADDAAAAVEAAQNGQPEWAARTAVERGNVVRAIAELLRERRDEASELVAAETGKSLALALGETDAAVLLVPSAALGEGWTAWLLGGLVAAGVAAAFLSTSSGLVVSLAGVLYTDVLRGRWKDFRLAAVVSAVLPIAMALTVERLDFGLTVPLVFAVAASTFCPVLVLGIWWRGLTAPGAVAGLLVGGIGSGCAVGWTLLTNATTGWAAVLLGQPAAWSVPASLATMVVVSRLTRARIPVHAGRFMVRLHTPEAVDLQR